MNIDYSEIITKANYRKTNLQKLAELLNSAGEMSRNLSFVQGWSNSVRDLYKVLDTEGRQLIPDIERKALEYMPYTCIKLNEVQLDGYSGISMLIQKAQS